MLLLNKKAPPLHWMQIN